MSTILEEAIVKFKANDIEGGQQVLIKLLNDDPGNDAAWKMLIESYDDLEFQMRLANEYFNLTGGSLKATQMVLRYTRLKNDRYAGAELGDQKWLEKLKWMDRIKRFGRIKWTRALLFKVITGLLAFILLTYMLWIGTSISSAARANKARLDFERLSGVYSEQVLKYSELEASHTGLETQYTELQASYDKLLRDYQALVAGQGQ
jgi:hypothetical protein